MRVLGIETSTRRGSVAIVERGVAIARRAHETPNAHAEKLLPLVEQLLAEAGWSRTSLDRIGVGVGPGAFTGLRVGIALAQGMGLGLGRPVFGIGSLEAMAAAVPADAPGLRVPVLDARRGEVFVGVYAVDGGEIAAPSAVACALAGARIDALAPGARVVVGETPASELRAFRSEATDLPDARWTALLAERRSLESAGAEPRYVRDAGAVVPDLPPSPFSE